MKTNYHTHTRRCLHADGTEEDYIRSALEAGVSILGFSDHAPFPDHDYGYRMPYEELETYFSEVDRLSNVYASDIMICKSLEIEYLPWYRNYYEKLLGEYRLDYLLLGEHYFLSPSGEVVNITTQATGTETFLDYAQAVAQAMRTGYFRIVAHPDIFTMNHFAWDRNCDAAADLILDAAAQTGVILEYNANGYRRGIQHYPDGDRYMYPHKNFWLRVSGSQIPVIVGSDCHNPSQVWDECMPRAIRELNEMGITPITSIETR